jgi:hypothetical protein
MVMMGLATYGAYRVGKSVITSKMVRDKLTGVLRAVESKLKPDEASRLKRVISNLSTEVKSGKTVGQPYGPYRQSQKALPPGTPRLAIEGGQTTGPLQLPPGQGFTTYTGQRGQPMRQAVSTTPADIKIPRMTE